MPGNVSDLLQLHQKQPPFAEVCSLRYIKKKTYIKNYSFPLMATHCHNPSCPTAPKIYQAPKQAGVGAFVLISVWKGSQRYGKI